MTRTLPRPVIKEETDTRTRRAPLWKVILHNDDKTTMDFVVWLLMAFFGHDIDRASTIMMEIHKTGQGIAGVYAQEVAELKRDQAISTARAQKYPLAVTIEPDE